MTLSCVKYQKYLMSKNDLIKGVTLNDCYEFVDSGSDEMPEELVVYFDLMDKVRSMHNRAVEYGTKESILKHLIKVDGLSRHIATKVYYDALEYFYSSAQLSQQAQRNVYADQIDRMIAIATPFVKDDQGAKRVVSMLMDAWKARGLDKEQPQDVPEDWFKKQMVLYTTDALKAGLDPINRLELAKTIDVIPDLTEKEKKLLRQEALIEDVIIFPDVKENPRKDK